MEPNRELVLPRWLEEERKAQGQRRSGAVARDIERDESHEKIRALQRRQIELEQQLAERKKPATALFPARRGDVRLFDPDELEGFQSELTRHHSDSDDRRRAKVTVEKITQLGPWRTPVRFSRSVRRKLARMREDFPNFHRVLHFVEASLALRRRGGVPIPPILLDGPPGVGKTLFAGELAAALDVPFRRVDMAAAQAAFQLVGSDKAWANSQTGVVFESLAFGQSCSPVLVLDELDKACGSDERYPVIGALYGLLEPLTARDFRDASFPQFALDARYVIWLGTSNDADQIVEPLRSRMRCFSIKAPDLVAMQALVHRIAASIWREAGRRNRPPQLGAGVVDRLAALPPRTAKLALSEAFGRAVLEHRDELSIEDVPAAAPKSRGIGFV